jgi:hypothetical protein
MPSRCNRLDEIQDIYYGQKTRWANYKKIRAEVGASHDIWEIFVPHSKSGLVPRSSLSGAGQLGFWETGEGGTMGEGWGKWGQFISTLRRRRTIPVTAGGCQVSESRAERGARGARGARETALCIYANVMCM